MYRIMIVDDDEIIRKGLAKNIDWSSHEIEVVYEAKNGKDALNNIEEVMPNVIISDIQMPIMDGLELAECVYRLYPRIKMVLLTAYEEFEYAKRALKYKVSEYVLKYESDENIIKAVQHAIELYKLDTQNQELVMRSRDILINNFFYEVCSSDIEEETIKKSMYELNLKFSGDYFSVIMVRLQGLDIINSAEIVVKRRELFSIIEKQLISSIRKIYSEVYSFQDNENLNIVLVSDKPNKEQDKLVISVENNLKILEKNLKINLLIGLGRWYEGIKNLYYCYSEILKDINLEYMIDSGENNTESKIINCSEYSESQRTPLKIIGEITHYIEKNYADESLSLNTISQKVHLSPNYVSFIFKKYKGINISDYIIKVRIKKAEELLVSTDYKTYEIANKIGYTNSQYFSVLFKKMKGLSPTEFRKKFLKINAI
ncbi:response regulator transcription factor [Thermoanaerobacterium thermosaccharolyticum]|uniref:response regulator transcription factor n=1 Tax=Thermoanaerobacterium thermosaccharolyticum TaxID=1517 RepID=UPI003DA9C7AE